MKYFYLSASALLFLCSSSFGATHKMVTNNSFRADASTRSSNHLSGNSASSFGLQPIINSNSPAEFVGFTVQPTDRGHVIQWSTAEEINTSVYEVECREEGSEWRTIAIAMAIGSSTELNTYSFPHKISTAKNTFYRIRQVDNEGHFRYSGMQTVKAQGENNSGIKITATQNRTVLLQFADPVKRKVTVRFLSLAGQVMAQQEYSQPQGTIICQQPPLLKGNYIVSVSNGQEMNAAQQITL